MQALGTVRGRDLFFHARHGVWTCEVADHNGCLPSDGHRDDDGYYREGVDPDNGYMPHAEAVRLIGLCLREYTADADD